MLSINIKKGKEKEVAFCCPACGVALLAEEDAEATTSGLYQICVCYGCGSNFVLDLTESYLGNILFRMTTDIKFHQPKQANNKK